MTFRDLFPSIQRPWVDGLEIMTDLQKAFVFLAVLGTGCVLLVMGGMLACDILQAYREKRIRELNRRMNK